MTIDDVARYYDRQGQPMTEDEWQVAMNDFDSRCLAREVVADGYVVTTTWFGNDPEGREPPHIFGTLVEGTPGSSWETTYATEDQAQAGHVEAVDKARRGH